MENEDGAFDSRQPSTNYQKLIISTYNLNIKDKKPWFFENIRVWGVFSFSMEPSSLIGIAGVTLSEQCTLFLRNFNSPKSLYP